MVEHGAILIGVAERDGSMFNINGFDPVEVFNYVKKNQGVLGFSAAQ